MKQKSRKVATKPKSSNKWWIVGILVVTFISFSPSLQSEFVNWDDDRNIYDNETVLNLNWENVKELFTSTVIGNYNPLSNTLLGIEHRLFEGSDQYHMYFHLTNILLHLLCVYLVFLLGNALGLKKNATIILTLLFALHPLRVESVAWITEIKDVLYASFFFGGLYLYAKKRTNTSSKLGFPMAVFLLFFIGLFAKIQMVIFPLALVLVDYIQGRKDLIKSSIRHWPFFLGSLIFGLIGIFALEGGGSLETNNTFNFFQRMFIGSYSWCIYLVKSIIPYKMSPLYPYPPELSLWHYISMAPFLASIIGIYLLWKKNKGILFFGTAFFFVNIIFLLQILGAGQGYLADRFTYVSYFGLFYIFAYYLAQWMENVKYKKWIPIGLTVVFIGFSALTYAQNKVWKNSETLWSHVLKYYTMSTLPYGNRANHYRDIGEKEKALKDYSKSIALISTNAAPYNSRAKLYFSMNQDQKALVDYHKAVELAPEDAEYVTNRGAAYAKLGMWEKSLADLSKGLELNPKNSNAYLNRSLVYQEMNRWDKTLEDLILYLKIKPNDADIWYEKARVHRALSEIGKAMKSYNKAIKLKPREGLFYAERAKLHFVNKNFKQSAKDVEMAQKLGYKVEGQLIDALKKKGVL